MQHDAVSRWLTKSNFTPADLWQQVKPLAKRETGYDNFINHWQQRWDIEEFYRGIKQTTGIEKCYSIKSVG